MEAGPACDEVALQRSIRGKAQDCDMCHDLTDDTIFLDEDACQLNSVGLWDVDTWHYAWRRW